MSQLCFTQMSIHRLSWFSGFVQIFFIAGNSCSAKITLLSNDILKIPTLFLSVLTLLSRPFSSADFKTLSQKRNGIVHLVQLGACERGVCSGDRGGSHLCSMSSSLRTWFPEPINLTWALLCTQCSKAAQSSTFSSTQLLVQHTHWATVNITGRAGRGYLAQRSNTTFTWEEFWLPQAPSVARETCTGHGVQSWEVTWGTFEFRVGEGPCTGSVCGIAAWLLGAPH